MQLIWNQNGTETKARGCYNARKVWFGYRKRQIERDRQRSTPLKRRQYNVLSAQSIPIIYRIKSK